MSDRSIREAFAGGNAFIPFITCGDPDIQTTKALVLALVDAGAQIIELGIPFSDPTAEGPVIQEANMRSLSGGITTDAIFEMVRELREDTSCPVAVPLVLMTYANVVFHYGTERFCANAEEAGIDGLILPDVPFEEKDEFAEACRDRSIAYISMIAPTSKQRIQMIASHSEGFIYCVSSLGVTGMREQITTDLDSIVAQVREVTDTPVAIGFGISSPEQARLMASKADGAIVGSAIVRMVAEKGRESVSCVHDFALSLAAAIHGEDLPQQS